MIDPTKKYLLVDIDECCLGWIDGFRSYASVVLNRNLDSFPDQYSMENWLGLSDKEAVTQIIFDFNNKTEDFAKLKPIRDADKFLHKFKDLGYTIVAITSCSELDETKAKRVQNLEEVFGKDIFESIYCLALHESKKPYLNMYPNGSIWVEDKIFNAMMGVEVGHRAYVMRQPSNAGHEENYPQLKWVDNWQDIYNDVKEL